MYDEKIMNLQPHCRLVVLASVLCVFCYAAVAHASDVITTAYPLNLSGVPTLWDPAKNPDAIVDLSTVDSGNQVVPSGLNNFYIGGTGNTGTTAGLIMKYDVTTGRIVWKKNSLLRESRAMTVDSSGDIYTAQADSAHRSNSFAKYSGTDGSVVTGWPKAQSALCSSGANVVMMNLALNGNYLYAGGTGTGLSPACGGNAWRLVSLPVANNTGSDWLYRYVSTQSATMSPNGFIAVGGSPQYLYALGKVDYTGATGVLGIARYAINSGVVNTAVNRQWSNAQNPGGMTPGQIIVDDDSTHTSTYGWTFVTASYQDGNRNNKFRYITIAYDTAGTSRWTAIEEVDGTYSASPTRNNIAGGLAMSPDGTAIYVTGKSYGATTPATTDTFFTVKYNAVTGGRMGTALTNFGLGEQGLGIAVTNSGVFLTGLVPYDLGSIDLTATSVTANPTSVTQGASIAVGGSVTNLSASLSKPYYVHYCIDSADATSCRTASSINRLNETRMTPLAGGSTATVPPSSISTNSITGGSPHTLWLCADTYNVSPNENKANNCTSIPFNVYNPQVTLSLSPPDNPAPNNSTPTLSWDGVDVVANSCSSSDPAFTNAAISSSRTVTLQSPPYSKTFTVTCKSKVDSTTNVSGNLTIGIADILVPVLSLNASPMRVRKPGHPTISWSATGVTGPCTITKNDALPAWRTLSVVNNAISPPDQVVDTIDVTTKYKLSCGGIAAPEKEVVVNLVPTYQDF